MAEFARPRVHVEIESADHFAAIDRIPGLDAWIPGRRAGSSCRKVKPNRLAAQYALTQSPGRSHDLWMSYFIVFFSHASISGFQCCISGAFQPLIPWPPPSIGINSQLAPAFFIASHMAGDWSYVT